jgi:uncharacterized BrkB/YihY/UPF0761 family membrane protein
MWKRLGLWGIIVKILIFLLLWASTLVAVSHHRPELIDWPKLVTNIFSNTLVFMIAYVLTVLGYRYTKNEKRKKKEKL